MTATDLRSSFLVDGVRLVTFVELDERSREVVRCWRNAASVRRWMFTDHEIGRDEHRQFLERLREDDEQFWWLMQVDALDVAVMNFQRYDRHQRTAHFGFLVNPARVRRGVGWLLVYHALVMAFEQAGLETLRVEILADNAAAIGLCTSAGFRREGTLRSQAVNDSRPTDVVVMGMPEPAWVPARDRIHVRARQAIERLRIEGQPIDTGTAVPTEWT